MIKKWRAEQRKKRLWKLLDLGMEDVRKLKGRRKRAIAWAVYALSWDGGHHKQWFLAQLLESQGVSLEEVNELFEAAGYSKIGKGIAP